MRQGTVDGITGDRELRLRRREELLRTGVEHGEIPCALLIHEVDALLAGHARERLEQLPVPEWYWWDRPEAEGLRALQLRLRLEALVAATLNGELPFATCMHETEQLLRVHAPHLLAGGTHSTQLTPRDFAAAWQTWFQWWFTRIGRPVAVPTLGASSAEVAQRQRSGLQPYFLPEASAVDAFDLYRVAQQAFSWDRSHRDAEHPRLLLDVGDREDIELSSGGYWFWGPFPRRAAGGGVLVRHEYDVARLIEPTHPSVEEVLVMEAASSARYGRGIVVLGSGIDGGVLLRTKSEGEPLVCAREREGEGGKDVLAVRSVSSARQEVSRRMEGVPLVNVAAREGDMHLTSMHTERVAGGAS